MSSSRLLVAVILVAATPLAVPARAEAAIGAVDPAFHIEAAPDPDQCNVFVRGYVRTSSQAEAQGLIGAGHKIVVRVWGHDPRHR